MDSLKWLLLFMCLCFTVIQTEASSWTIKVPSSVKGLPGSCVVIPCSFNYPDPGRRVTEITGMWEEAGNQLIYHPNESKMMQQYRKRTELLGDVRQKTCSLKIDPLQQSDRGPFHFRIEMADYERYSYRQNTVSIEMISELNPIGFSVKEEAAEGQTVSASCSVSHSCPTSPPVFTWSHSGEEQVQSQQLDDGQWRTTSTLNFQPTSGDHNKPLQCTVTYKGGQHHKTSRVLKVNHAPVNVKVEHKSDVKEGEAVQLRCSSDARPPASSYQWHSETGAELHQGNVYMLPNVSRHTGALYCTAINSVGRGKSNPVQLNVLYAPVNVKVEHKSDVKEGEAVQLRCSSDAHPPASSYQWHNETGAQLHQGNIYMLPNVSRHTGALYCTAINSVGRGKSNPVQLNVLYAPEIKMGSSCSSKADVMKCVCIAESKPPSMVHFVLSDRSLPSTKVETHGSVTIGTMEFESSEVVYCLANNTLGNANLTLSLPVNSKMQNLYIVIASGAGGILLMLLITVIVVKKCRGRPEHTPPQMSTTKADKDVALPQYAATQRKGTNYDDAHCSSIYANDHVYGNMETDGDDAIYANV